MYQSTQTSIDPIIHEQQNIEIFHKVAIFVDDNKIRYDKIAN